MCLLFIDFCQEMNYIYCFNALMIAQNVKNIRQRIASACARVGRKPEEVTLVAVTKTFKSEVLREVVEAGVFDIGENYVQELLDKRQALADQKIRWHFIGHLQTNKVKYVADWIHMVHSVDSLSLGKEISKRAEQAGRKIPVLVEVNTTAEKTKFGVMPEAILPLVKDLSVCSNISIAGLMTIGPFLPDAEGSRPSFRMLREIKERVQQDGFPMRHLSMGMTNDFEVAIEENATLVRIGTAIFGKRMKQQ
jgi:pyridoxal phosphate enzyme (YggS family)